MLLLLDCEFLSLIFIIIYVGAISVLFLFAIMMVETKSVNLYRNKVKYFPLAFIFSSIFTISLVSNVFLEESSYPFLDNLDDFNLSYYNWYSEIDTPSELNIFADVLYTYYVLQFLFVGLILLFALIAVVFLTDTSSKKIVKEINGVNFSEKKLNKKSLPKSQSLDKQLARNNVFLPHKTPNKK